MATKQTPARSENVETQPFKAKSASRGGPSQLTGKQRQSRQSLRSHSPIRHNRDMGDEKKQPEDKQGLELGSRFAGATSAAKASGVTLSDTLKIVRSIYGDDTFVEAASKEIVAGLKGKDHLSLEPDLLRIWRMVESARVGSYRSGLSDQEAEALRAKAAESKRKYRENLSPERQAEIREKEAEARRIKRASRRALKLS